MSPSTVHWQALRRLDRDNTPAPGCKALAVAGQLPTCGLAPCALRGLGQAPLARPSRGHRRGRRCATDRYWQSPRLPRWQAKAPAGTRGRGGASPSAAYRARVTGRHLRPGPFNGLQPRRSARTGALRPGLHHACSAT